MAQLSYNEIEKDLAEFDRKSEENTAYFARLTSDIEGERLNISSANEEIVKIGSEITVLENNINFNNDNITRLNEEKLTLSKSDSEAHNEITAKENEIAEKIAKKTDLGEKLSSFEKELAELLSNSDSISRKIEGQIRELNLLSQNSADLRVEMVTANTTAEEITARATVLKEQKTAISANLSELNKELEENENFFKKLEESERFAQNILKGYELKHTAVKEKIDIQKSDCDTLSLDIEAKKRRVQILKDLENNMEGFGFAVKTVVTQSEVGVLRGICGVVSKLIKVDKEYSIAIETALGNAIQNVITETEADAKHAINYLKNNRGGRATFLPVATIRAREFKESGFENMFGFVGIASDLVECDSKYKEII